MIIKASRNDETLVRQFHEISIPEMNEQIIQEFPEFDIEIKNNNLLISSNPNLSFNDEQLNNKLAFCRLTKGPYLIEYINNTLYIYTIDYFDKNYTRIDKLDTTAEGKKNDAGKLRMDLIPVSLLNGISEVLTTGAITYGERNWEKGIAYSRCYAALLRHITAWWDGENLDPETGFSHLHHAACCLTFLIHYNSKPETYNKFDNRPIDTGDQS